jgi:cell division protein FtsQ
VAAHVAGGFFTVDVNAVRTAAEQLPWVYKATVKRVWPATLLISIEEQQAIVRWGSRGYLNKHGEPFFPEASGTVLPLPALAGPEGHERKVLKNYQSVARTLAPLGVKVTSVELDDRRAWHLQVGDGVLLELGRADTRERLQRFIRAYPSVFAARIAELKRVDMRYSNGFSVYWEQLASTPETDTQG